MDVDFTETLKHALAISNYVRVETVDGKTREGWLCTIDPCSGNLLLVTFRENKKIDTVHLIIAEAVSKLAVVEEPNEEMKAFLEDLFSSSVGSLPAEFSEELVKRKASVVTHLKNNGLPVKDNAIQLGAIEVGNLLTIQPPYGATNCISNNEIMLDKIRNLLENVPEPDS